MTFLNVQFPLEVAAGASGGPIYSTDVIVMGSGFEQRNQNWAGSRATWDVSRACDTEAKRGALIAFFRVAKGRANSFRFRDFTDYKASLSEGILAALGGNDYQLQKRYSNAAGAEDRDIIKPVSGTLTIRDGAAVLVEAVDYSVDYATGIVTALGGTPPVPDSWAGEFDVHARFAQDSLRLAHEALEVFRGQGIEILEVRGAV